ncbi:ABC transporter ATP-binding protein [Microbacterium caowuchunii]|uniref:ABC transporter ATP-binding protein n=1 Tax=Microbacterium caowuchunii TaxID=2614638 RepID=A0A5N0TB68_9MICO|nr:ABC transporter ATP-binding protein [Microbacterium caowuchunii]KAA9132265.1 ABC transporter ATP-binding protein [Microbacterium caowuchunii]
MTTLVSAPSPGSAQDGGPGDSTPFLRVSDLRVFLPTGPRREIEAVTSVSLEVRRGERVGIVGESGSGKSVTGRAIAGLLPTNPRVRVSGSIRFDGREMVGARPKAWDEVRTRSVGMIFQDPLTFLNPVMKVGAQVREAIPADRGKRVPVDSPDILRFLQLAGLEDAVDLAGRYPHELSGGQRQRVLIAIGIAKGPDLILADEPTTALDATVQRHVLATLSDTVSALDTALIMISHDLAVVASMTERIYVMYAGRVVESGPTRQVLDSPQHLYTQALLRSVRSLTEKDTELWSIPPELRREIDELVRNGDDA